MLIMTILDQDIWQIINDGQALFWLAIYYATQGQRNGSTVAAFLARFFRFMKRALMFLAEDCPTSVPDKALLLDYRLVND